MRDFAALLRIRPMGRAGESRRLIQPARELSAKQAARRAEAAAEWAPWMTCADYVRRSLRAADGVRAAASVLGPEHPSIWDALARAAKAERSALDVQAEMDSILESGRLS